MEPQYFVQDGQVCHFVENTCVFKATNDCIFILKQPFSCCLCTVSFAINNENTFSLVNGGAVVPGPVVAAPVVAGPVVAAPVVAPPVVAGP